MDDQNVARVRDGADIAALVSETVALLPRGAALVGDCPWCTADSLHVNAKRGFFHCFGCKASGSAFDWIMRRDGVSFAVAVDLVAKRALH